MVSGSDRLHRHPVCRLGVPAFRRSGDSQQREWPLAAFLARRAEHGPLADLAWQSWLWVLPSVLYFLIVVVGAALVFRSQRRLTAVYNADPGLIQSCIAQACKQLGLEPARSGNLFVFGVEPSIRLPADSDAGIQTAPLPKTIEQLRAFRHETVVLEVEPFAPMRHVTLRWDPPQSPLRRQVEMHLEKVLAETPAQPSELGGWLTISGITLFGLTVIVAITMAVVRLWTAGSGR